MREILLNSVFEGDSVELVEYEKLELGGRLEKRLIQLELLNEVTLSVNCSLHSVLDGDILDSVKINL